MVVTSAFILYAGFTALCLSKSRHSKALGLKMADPRQPVSFLISGWALLAVSLGLCLGYSRSWSLGLVDWLGAASVVLLLLVFLFAFYPRKAVWLAKIALPVAAFYLVMDVVIRP